MSLRNIIRRETQNRFRAFGVVIVVGTMFAGCGGWPSEFEQIKGDQPRMLDMVYRNVSAGPDQFGRYLAEAAPGDTVEVDAFFSGEEIRSITWLVSYDVRMGDYGTGDTALNYQPLELLPGDEDPGFPRARDIAFRFVVPDSLLEVGVYRLLSMLPPEVADQIPDSIVGSLVTGVEPEQLAVLLGQAMGSESQDTLFKALQLLTTPVRILAVVNDFYRFRSDFMVRMHRFFEGSYPYIHTNRNPTVRFVGIVKMKRPEPDRDYVGSLRPSDTVFVLASELSYIPERYFGDPGALLFTDTLLVDTGYVYAGVTDTGVFWYTDTRDTATSLTFTPNGTGAGPGYEPEIYRSQWFVQHSPDQEAVVSEKDLISIFTTGGATTPISPARDTAITEATLWVQVYDEFLGEFQRPSGSSLREVHVNFQYTKDYAEKWMDN